jgi:hypothetical protein
LIIILVVALIVGFFCLHKLFQLSSIKPDSSAFWTIIYFDSFFVHHKECDIFTYGAFHIHINLKIKIIKNTHILADIPNDSK